MDIKIKKNKQTNNMVSYFSYCQDNIKGIMPYVVLILCGKILKYSKWITLFGWFWKALHCFLAFAFWHVVPKSLKKK